MPIKKWLIQYAVALPLLFTLFGGVQYMKGKALQDAVEFGIIWSLISLAIFAANRIYQFRKGIHCAVCNDLPERD
ncbi:hypothetical protein LJ739_01385 [Aestuariibacter halophilus]|uniref:Uncharacterized protein n=1 Tax=Fluctibacter halophilus TaxID=226011 RepID=A0ABS8G2Y4_9ALTE|nr:hypothetical protein [Aestuariibacter halophilus]MCC2614890.1 hypothetical protein [Aestuariibacter halophilus]